MRLICPGCGSAFKRSGLPHHVRQSKDPRCHFPNAIRKPLPDNQGDAGAMPVPGPAVMSSDENEPEDRTRLSVPVDASDDLARNNADYEGPNFRVDKEGDQDMTAVDDTGEGDNPEHPVGTQEEGEAELNEALLAEEHRLEPERLMALPDNVEQEPEDAPSEQTHAPFRLRGGFERPLANRPEIEKFGNWNAGTVFERAHRNSNQDYHRAVGITESPNPYTPFSSKLDWEIARWAKMRGPGSNALTELLHIEGVRFPSTNSQF